MALKVLAGSKYKKPLHLLFPSAAAPPFSHLAGFFFCFAVFLRCTCLLHVDVVHFNPGIV